MHRRLRLTPAPLAALVVLIALVGCGGATPTASIAPTTAPTAVPASATVAPSISLAPTAVASAAAAPTTAPSAVATVVPTSASVSLPTARPATVAATNTVSAPADAKNAVPALGITDPAKWYNTAPLTLEALRGKPVLIVFWSDI